MIDQKIYEVDDVGNVMKQFYKEPNTIYEAAVNHLSINRVLK